MRFSHARRSLIHPSVHVATNSRRESRSLANCIHNAPCVSKTGYVGQRRGTTKTKTKENNDRKNATTERTRMKQCLRRTCLDTGCIGCIADGREGGTRNFRPLHGTRRGRVACFVCAFLLSRVCPAARRERGCLMQMKRTMCFNSRPRYLYMLSGSLFSAATVYFCLVPRRERNTVSLYTGRNKTTKHRPSTRRGNRRLSDDIRSKNRS